MNVQPVIYRRERRLLYEEMNCNHPVARRIIEIALRKKSNLIASADVATSEELLSLAEKVGPYIVALKLHIDIISDFTPALIDSLKKVARDNDFLLFEDRKYADIGNTQELQFKQGIYKTAEWADMITVHPIAGELSLKVFDNIGVVIIASMSTKGTLTDEHYFKNAIELSLRSHNVMGVVSQFMVPEDLLLFTPGVNLSETGDAKGQQYNTPDKVFGELFTDFIIVGRGIYRADDPIQAALKYKKAGWEAYLSSLNN